ncbi:MAG: alpha/beta hydrolase [SAR202 cluster bacterium]|nr:alpha/beta hydrolase [SAR202 cluster bacterium]|tara:strand:- start:4110 stop:4883 length:774 start_codon:yes stop_codon:yes gene_type:complete
MANQSTHKQIEVPCVNGTINCNIKGNGRSLVFVHGALGTGLAHFRDQIEYFSTTYTVFLPDLLGHGQSERRKSFLDNFYENDSQDIASLIQSLGIGPVDLCGFSDGAIVSMLVAKNYPELVRSLVTIGGQSITDEKRSEFRKMLTPIKDIHPSLKQALARHHGEDYWEELVESYIEGSESFHIRSKGVFLTDLEKISAPTLIVHGESDPWVNPSNARILLNDITNAQVITFPETGHEVQREKPNEFNESLANFLNSV